MINRILDEWSFHMKFMKTRQRLVSYNSYEMTTRVRSSIFMTVILTGKSLLLNKKNLDSNINKIHIH